MAVETVASPVVEEPVPEAQPVPEAVTKALSMKGKFVGECVTFIQDLYGDPEGFKGSAGVIQPNSKEPAIGSAVLLRESPYGHVALITDIKDTSFVLCESNYGKDHKGRVTCGREISKTYEKIRGFYSFTTVPP